MAEGFQLGFEFEPDKSTAGYRLHELALYNWGTFHGRVQVLRPDGRTAGILGANGSGKSTIADALLTLLVPNRKRNYNLASAQGGARERDEKAYIRGIYAERHDDESGGARSEKLREDGKHYTVLLARFHNVTYNQDISLAQVLWIGPDGGRVKRAHIVHDGVLTIEEHFSKLGNQSTIKKELKSLGLKVYDEFQAYSEQFHKRLFMDQARQRTPMEIFNQAVCIKDVRNLDSFIREHMLDDGDSDGKLESLRNHFADLKTTHDEIVKADCQLQNLLGIQKAREKWENRNIKLLQLEFWSRALEPWLKSVEAEYREQDALQKQTELAKLKTEEGKCSQQIEQVTGKIKNLEQDLRESEEGKRLSDIADQLKRLREELGRVAEHANRYRVSLQIWAPGTEISDAATFSGFRNELQKSLPELKQKLAKCTQDLAAKRHELQLLTRQIIEQEKELQDLIERGSNIPQDVARLRDGMAQALGMESADLPFVGELLEVREGFEKWRGALERLLRDFALAVWVHPVHSEDAESYLLENNLSGKLAFLSLGNLVPSEKESGSVVEMLECRPELSDSEQAILKSELYQRFPHVASLANEESFPHLPYAISPEGFVREAGVLRIKDDSYSVDDASRHVLGREIEQKKKALLAKLDECEAKRKSLLSEKLRLSEEEKSLSAKQEAGSKLLEIATSFTEIDRAGIALKIDDLEKEEQRLRKSSNRLQAIEQELKASRQELEKLRIHQRDLDKKISEQDLLLKQSSQALEECRQVVQQFLEKERMEAQTFDDLKIQLVEKLGKVPEKIIELEPLRREWSETLGGEIRKSSKKLTEERDRLIKLLQKFVDDPDNLAFRDILGLEGYGELSSATFEPFDNLRLRIEKDDLPKNRERFERKLKKDVIQHVSNFRNELHDHAHNIKSRIKDLNGHLARVVFDRKQDTYIRLVCSDTRDFRVKEFKGELDRAMEGSVHADTDVEELERRYHRVGKLLAWLDKEEARTRKVIDVRNWFDFRAEERRCSEHPEGGEIVQSYRGAGGKSGGEKNRLASTILATAIAYQYGIDVDNRQTETFRLVVVDEMFSKTDDDFSEYLLRLFKEFHLQLLVVQPLDPKVYILRRFAERYHLITKQGNHSRIQNLSAKEFTEASQGEESEENQNDV